MSIPNPFDTMRQAVQEAKMVNRAVDEQANALADLLEGRLRCLTPFRLQKLKRALRDFDANKRAWKETAP